MAFKRRSSDDVPARGGKGERSPSMRDLLQCIEWGKKAAYSTVRLYQGIVPVGLHDYPLYRKDGSEVISDKTGKQSTIPKMCLAFDPDTVDRVEGYEKKCPYCKCGAKFKIEYWAEGIVREEVEQEPAKNKPSKEETKTGYKDLGNEASWTPVRAIRMTSNTYKRLQNLKQLNKVSLDGEKKPVAVDHPEHGCDVSMNFDPDATGDGMYGLQKGERVAITEDEEKYLRWDIEGAVVKATEDKDEAQRNADWLSKHRDGAESGGDEEEEVYEEGDQVNLTDDEDEEYSGTVLESTDTKIRIRTEDGPKTFKWDNVASIEKVKVRGKGKGKSQDDEDDEPKTKPKPSKKEESEDDDEPSGKSSKKPKDDAPSVEEGDNVTVVDEDGDEVYSGSVTAVTSKKVTVEKNGKEKSFTTADHTFKPAKKSSKKEEAEEEEPEADEKDDFKKGDKVTVVIDEDDEKTGKITAIDAKSVTIEDDEEEEHTFKRAKVTLKAAKKASTKEKAPDRKPAAKRTYDFDD